MSSYHLVCRAVRSYGLEEETSIQQEISNILAASENFETAAKQFVIQAKQQEKTFAAARENLRKLIDDWEDSDSELEEEDTNLPAEENKEQIQQQVQTEQILPTEVEEICMEELCVEYADPYLQYGGAPKLFDAFPLAATPLEETLFKAVQAKDKAATMGTSKQQLAAPFGDLIMIPFDPGGGQKLELPWRAHNSVLIGVSPSPFKIIVRTNVFAMLKGHELRDGRHVGMDLEDKVLFKEAGIVMTRHFMQATNAEKSRGSHYSAKECIAEGFVDHSRAFPMALQGYSATAQATRDKGHTSARNPRAAKCKYMKDFAALKVLFEDLANLPSLGPWRTPFRGILRTIRDLLSSGFSPHKQRLRQAFSKLVREMNKDRQAAAHNSHFFSYLLAQGSPQREPKWPATSLSSSLTRR